MPMYTKRQGVIMLMIGSNLTTLRKQFSVTLLKTLAALTRNGLRKTLTSKEKTQKTGFVISTVS